MEGHAARRSLRRTRAAIVAGLFAWAVTGWWSVQLFGVVVGAFVALWGVGMLVCLIYSFGRGILGRLLTGKVRVRREPIGEELQPAA